MPFEKYKASHGGQGPFEAFGEAIAGPYGLFGRKGLREQRELTDQLIDRVQSTEGLESLAGLTAAGQAPMTVEEHAEYRAGLTQAVLNLDSANERYEMFTEHLQRLRGTVVTKNDTEILDTLEVLGQYNQNLIHSGDPNNVAKGLADMSGVMKGLLDYTTKNEDQRLQMEASEAAGRNEIRGEIQSFVNANIVAPMIQDTTNFNGIMAQTEGRSGEEIVPPYLVTEALEYMGAALRQSDDGSWSFSIGGLGLTDESVPTMTYSQLRNQMAAAQQGRQQTMSGVLNSIGGLAERRGFRINGTQAEDLLFPLADAAYRERELETLPPKLSDNPRAAGDRAASGIGSFFEAGGQMMRNLLGMPNQLKLPDGTIVDEIDYGNGRIGHRARSPSAPPARNEPSLRAPVRGPGTNNSNLPGTVGGVYQPRFMRRRTND